VSLQQRHDALHSPLLEYIYISVCKNNNITYEKFSLLEQRASERAVVTKIGPKCGRLSLALAGRYYYYYENAARRAADPRAVPSPPPQRERERQGGVYKSAIIGTGHIKDASIINNLCLFVRAAEPLISRALQGAALA
jgi:hypothetical protein